MKTYNSNEATQALEDKGLQGWEVKGNAICKSFKFKDFKQAMDFMVKAGEKAEEMNHHPDWSNVYNRVDIRLSTHDAGGITDKDFELATAMENVFSSK